MAPSISLVDSDLRAMVKLIDDARCDEPGEVVPWALLERLDQLIPADGCSSANWTGHTSLVAHQYLVGGRERGVILNGRCDDYFGHCRGLGACPDPGACPRPTSTRCAGRTSPPTGSWSAPTKRTRRTRRTRKRPIKCTFGSRRSTMPGVQDTRHHQAGRHPEAGPQLRVGKRKGREIRFGPTSTTSGSRPTPTPGAATGCRPCTSPAGAMTRPRTTTESSSPTYEAWPQEG